MLHCRIFRTVLVLWKWISKWIRERESGICKEWAHCVGFTLKWHQSKWLCNNVVLNIHMHTVYAWLHWVQVICKEKFNQHRIYWTVCHSKLVLSNTIIETSYNARSALVISNTGNFGWLNKHARAFSNQKFNMFNCD